MTLFRRLRAWFDRHFGRRVRPYHVALLDELPEHLESGCLYAIGGDFPWLAALVCPCGCQRAIQLSLLADDRPRWSLVLDSSGLPTLHPSVWRTEGCKAHFFLRAGHIVWAGEAVNSKPQRTGLWQKLAFWR